MKHFGYCDFCMAMTTFDIIETETEYGKQYRKEHYGILPNGIGTNIDFKCERCKTYRKPHRK